MANNTQSSSSLFGWVVVIGAVFLFGKTCHCGPETNAPVGYTNSPAPSPNAAWPATKPQQETQSYKAVAPARVRPHRSRVPATNRYLIRGPRGGCYYINSNGNKVYVDRSLCN